MLRKMTVEELLADRAGNRRRWIAITAVNESVMMGKVTWKHGWAGSIALQLIEPSPPEGGKLLLRTTGYVAAIATEHIKQIEVIHEGGDEMTIPPRKTDD